MKRLFSHALDALKQQGCGYLGPQSFQGYLTRHGLKADRTAQLISVQHLDSLDPELRSAQVMVFRLGLAAGKHTQFALVQAQQSIKEFFLTDAPHDSTPTTFVPKVPMSDLYPFALLGSLSETGAVNLAIASGLLGHALGCDKSSPRVAPATGAASYTFDVWPYRCLSEQRWEHINGQVEIDAVYLGYRQGLRVLFVIEAKHGKLSPLSKAKLAYACNAVMTKGVPLDTLIVPVYLRSWMASHRRIHFSVTECKVWQRERSYVTDIEAQSTCLLEMAFS